MLRLKGGDPFVFGRGGEEALALAAARIPFRLVPGVTAAAGGLAAAGIPMTHRTTNSAVTLLTGHDAAGGVPDALDWQAIAQGAPVLIFYMALRQLDAIATRLTRSGLAGETPVALISHATTGAERVVEAPLAEAAAVGRERRNRGALPRRRGRRGAAPARAGPGGDGGRAGRGGRGACPALAPRRRLKGNGQDRILLRHGPQRG